MLRRKTLVLIRNQSQQTIFHTFGSLDLDAMLAKLFNILDSRGGRLIALTSMIAVVLTIMLLMLLNSTKLIARLENNQIQNLDTFFKRGKLVAICETSTISFFKNRNISLGYEYEILKHIAHELKVQLEVKPYSGSMAMNKALIENRGDLIADFRVIGNHSPEHFIHTQPHTMSVISLVQRVPGKKEKNPPTLIENIYQLEGKSIHVQTNSIAHKKLKYFTDEYAISIDVIAVQDSREELIEKVSKGEYNYTVIEREIIAANRQLYNNLDYSLNLSFPYRIAFTLRGNSEPLRDTINTILDSFLQSDKYKQLVYKYIESDQKNFHRKVSLLLMNGQQISTLDAKLKSEAAKIDWDWRLLSALIYKESRFVAYATSSQGTYGLMQFVGRTGAKYGVFPNSTPETQIEGGVKYLSFLQNLYADVPDINHKSKFVLASYNAGPSHVQDARRVAAHFNEDHTQWEVVARYLTRLNQPEIYNLECVKHGAYNGQAAVNYVKAILSIHAEFENIYPAN